MREIIKYEALDGRIFMTREECEEYEIDHPFTNPKAIKFYSVNGKKIKDPDESVFLDSNQFVVFSEEALSVYQEYRLRFGLKAPALPSMPVPYPLHYSFKNNEWLCYEEAIAMLTFEMRQEFSMEYEDNDEDRHNLVETE